MRRLLDQLYDSAAALAALCLVGLLGRVVLGIAGRLLHFHGRGAAGGDVGHAVLGLSGGLGSHWRWAISACRATWPNGQAAWA